MNPLIKLSYILPIMAFAAGCAGNREVTPENETISGPLGEYFSIVNRTYKINDGTVNVEFERIADGLPAPWNKDIPLGYGAYHAEPGMEIEFLDKDKDIVSTDNTDIIWDMDDLESLVALNVGETASIPFSTDKKRIKSFRIKSTFEYHEPSSDTGSVSGNSVSDDASAHSSDATSNTSSSEWDNVLDQYDDLVDSYIATYKKAMAGDMSAMTEYSSLLEKAEDLSEKLNSASADMTAGQMKRYMDITARMTSDLL